MSKSNNTNSRRQFLVTTAAGAAAAVGGSLLARRAAAAEDPRTVLAMTHVTVIDATGAPARRDMTVLVSGNRIAALGPSAQVAVPGDARVVNLHGRYLIPGLCDMHVHSGAAEINLPMSVANGVTSVREMWGHPYLHEWRDKVENGSIVGPRSVIASALIDGDPSLWNNPATRPAAPIVVTNEAEARQAVRDAMRDRADFLKLYSRLSRSSFHALAAEARRRHISFVGHCPDVVPIEEAAAAGVRSFEHLDGVWWSTSSRRTEIERAIAKIKIDPADAYGSWFRQIGALEWPAATSYDPRRAEAVFARLRRTGSYQVPTLTMLQHVDLPGGAGDPRLKYVPREEAAFWEEWAQARLKERTPQQEAQHRELFERRLRLVADMHRAGIPIMAGTDTGTAYIYAGFSLHDELALLVRAGLSPMAALQAATIQPARFLGRDASIGTIAQGKIADLVVLDADPLADIRNTQQIHAVVTRGRLITDGERRRMLEDVAKAANPPGATARTARPAMVGCGCHGPRPTTKN